MTDAILTLNVGSSSVKYALYSYDGGISRLAKGKIGGIGAHPMLESIDASRTKKCERIKEGLPSDHTELIRWLLDWIAREFSEFTITAAGHRIVHGGLEYVKPTLLTPKIVDALSMLSPLAPDHQPLNLAGVSSVAHRWPDVPQIACFDTAFHRTQPRIAQLYALPREYSDDGVMRYGFHGLSYEYIAAELPDHAGPRAEGRVIVAHLGHGASMCSMIGRKSQATSMGFTALDGLVMGQRCGDLDPGVVLYLMRARKMDAPAIEKLLSHQSGLLGVSGVSSDMRTLLDSDDINAKEAVDLFVYRAAREIGSLVSAIGGLDVLVFTGGIGENSAEIRDRISSECTWLGVRIDEQKNRTGAIRISSDDSAIDIFALPTNEELVIAQSVEQILSAQAMSHGKHCAANGGEHV